MGLENKLSSKREEITRQWFEYVVKTYDADSFRFMKNTKDPMSNPVGSNIEESLAHVFDALIEGKGRLEIQPLLDPPIRIRAVQEFAPSQAVGFVLYLKTIVRNVLGDDLSEKERLKFDQKVDGLLLIAFDIYMGCREQIFKFRAEYVKSRTLNLLEKADILCEVPEVGTEIIPHDVYKNGGFENK
jgi:hypothetical protein